MLPEVRMTRLRTTNPATGKPLADYEVHTSGEVQNAVDLAWTRFIAWRDTDFGHRAELLQSAARVLVERRDRYARLMTEEMGKPITQSFAEVDKCAWAARYYAESGAAHLAPETIAADAAKSYVRFDPLGPILAVMPWNFPFWQVFRAACPALMAGNVVLLKHASNVPGCALAIEEVFRDAGFPKGAFTALIISSSLAEPIIDDPHVRGVTLTGSDDAGAKIAARAGAGLKKTLLELGGSDPFVVLADADVAAAAKTASTARLINNGQSCIAAKRFIVEAPVLDEFTAAFVGHVEAARVGDPLDPATEVGPLAREDLLEALHAQVTASIARGARLLTGGRRLDRPGYFYQPTVLAEVAQDMPAADEETFGPVAAIIPARDEREALDIANASRFGLGAAVWSRDIARAERFAARVESGAVFVNGMVKSDPRLPFGGVKRSGYGRELGREGIREFVNVKTVVVS
jgi:succinate-semialdehyde dehydrogenase / glutarate-semialdehyde dehydrogenase